MLFMIALMLHVQELVATHWKEHAKPALDVFLQKVLLHDISKVKMAVLRDFFFLLYDGCRCLGISSQAVALNAYMFIQFMH